MSKVEITNVKTILTAPEGVNLVVVKVETNQDGLYGVGCATFTQRYLAVETAINEYLKPFLIGKDPQMIEDIWQTAMVSGYWRNGPVLNNAISGIDMALWDIKGKLAGMPVYQLLGGKCREGVACYKHADGNNVQEVTINVRSAMNDGYRYVRCQQGLYGGVDQEIHKPMGALKGSYYHPRAYMNSVIKLFDHLRNTVGWNVELLHDVHERLAPIDAVNFAKKLEKYQLYFLEDLLPPEQISWFENVRQQTSVPIAMGELFNNQHEWQDLITNRLIDFIRIHISQIGGITPAKKLVSLCEAYGVRTAWHGPIDVSPVGHAANIHLDISSINFGIQEWNGFNDAVYEVFTGIPEFKDGYVYPNERPGLGIDIDEEAAAKYPCKNELPEWTLSRLPDGTSARP
ncbi:enolase C-terminal domain-like protein [Haloplasma contractile]|nr:enolase C-terminal domain-like protein [Haloplasma contractile]